MEVCSSTLLQFDKICRACLMEKHEMLPLLNDGLKEKLKSVADIEVAEDEDLPNLMCLQCVDQCNNAYTFKQVCKRSNAVLQQYLSQEFKVELQTNTKRDIKTELPDQLSENVVSPKNMVDEIINEYVSDHLEESLDASTNDNNKNENGNFENDTTDKQMSFVKPPQICSARIDGVKEENEECLIDEIEEEEIDIKDVVKEELEDEKEFMADVEKETAENSRINIKIKEENEGRKTTAEKESFASDGGESFKGAQHLNHRKKIRPETKQNKCRLCNETFIHKYELKKHFRIHREEKQFKCNMCTRAYFRNCHLKEHLRRHTGERPFQCNFCHKRFFDSCTFHRHLLANH